MFHRPRLAGTLARALALAALAALGSVQAARAQELFVTSFDNSRVLRYDGTTGAFLDTFVPTAAGGLRNPAGLVFGPDGNLYVSSAGTE